MLSLCWNFIYYKNMFLLQIKKNANSKKEKKIGNITERQIHDCSAPNN